MQLNIITRNRNAIYGFAILWIVFFHASAIDHVDYTFGIDALQYFALVMDNGNVGVDIFLFLSGISLYFSFHRNQDAYAFIGRRAERIFLPVILIDGAYWFVKYIVLTRAKTKFVSSILLLQYWENGNEMIWYVSLIAAMYFIYPYLYGFFFRHDSVRRSIIRMVVLMLVIYAAIISFSKVNPDLYEMIEVAITRIPVFVFGSFLGKYVYENRKAPAVFGWLAFAGMILFFVILYQDLLHEYNRRFFFFLGGVSITVVLALLFAVMQNKAPDRRFGIRPFFSWVGGFSLELYLSHIMINRLYKKTPFYESGSMKGYLVVILLAFFMAWGASVLENLILKKYKESKARKADGKEDCMQKTG